MLALPELGIELIKAKIDTGARSSCLHTFKIEPFQKEGELWVRFWVHPEQKNTDFVKECTAKVIDQRTVKDSGGHEEQRYVIKTMLAFNGEQWPIEVTLTNRENMLFRMLLGRTAMHHRIIVDPTASFLIASPETKDHD